MRLDINLLESFAYVPGVRELPVVLNLVTDEPVEIGERVSIDGVMLELEGDEDVYFSYSERGFGFPSKTMCLDSAQPYRVTVDLMAEWREYDEDDELAHLRRVVAGSYRLAASVSVYLKKDDGSFQLVILDAQRDVYIPADS